MAIIYPASCRGTTAGALAQVKKHGFTTANGGLWSTQYVKSLTTQGFEMYFRHNEPLGILMNTLEKTSVDVEKLAQAVRDGMRTVIDNAREQQKQLADVSGKLRDGAEKLGGAVEKFSKIANNANFAETTRQAESLVASLERLAALQESGVLDKVIRAMSAR